MGAWWRCGQRCATTAQVSPVLRSIVIAAPDALATTVTALVERATGGAPLAEVRALATTAARGWVDAVLTGFVLALAREVRGAPSGGRTVALARSVADRVIDHGARRADAGAVAAVIDLFAARVVTAPGGPAISFPVDDTLAAALAPVLEGTAPAPPAIAAALHALIDEVLRRLFDEPVALLQLGAVSRAALAMGRSGLSGRAHRGVDGAVDDADAMARVAGFLARLALPSSAIVPAATARRGA
jgi:hypothetical protein